MQVFLIRHSDAVDAGPALPDPARFLSGRGRQAARAVGQRLRAESIRFDAVVASPLVRAVQTAELIAAQVGFPDLVAALPQLAPDSPPGLAASALAAQGQSVAVVGHEPQLSELAALLIGQRSFPHLRKTEVVLIEDGRAVWTLDPEKLEIRPLP